MCQVCPFARRDSQDPWGLRGGGAVECTVSGRSVASHVLSGSPSCPLGMHPDRRGILTYVWVRWAGVPAPIRWAMAWWTRGPLEGCGCIVTLKLAWNREVNLWNG